MRLVIEIELEYSIDGYTYMNGRSSLQTDVNDSNLNIKNDDTLNGTEFGTPKADLKHINVAERVRRLADLEARLSMTVQNYCEDWGFKNSLEKE